MAQPHSFRRRLATLLDDDAPRSGGTVIFNAALAVLIVVSVSAVILDSVESIRDEYAVAFLWIEHVATAIFAVEYLVRLWVCVDYRRARFRQPVAGRLRYMASFFAIIDLVAVLPSLLGLLGAGDLRTLRLLRLLRMLKLTRRSTTFSLLWAVFIEERHSIGALVFVICLALTISGALMYMIEGPAQPAIFDSIPASMWWAVETLTTVGYGDMVPVTTVGRVLGGVVSIVGIGTLALFTGLITVGFLDQLKLHRAARLAASAAGESNGNGAAEPDDPIVFARTAPPFNGTCPRCGYASPACAAEQDGGMTDATGVVPDRI